MEQTQQQQHWACLVGICVEASQHPHKFFFSSSGWWDRPLLRLKVGWSFDGNLLGHKSQSTAKNDNGVSYQVQQRPRKMSINWPFTQPPHSLVTVATSVKLYILELHVFQFTVKTGADLSLKMAIIFETHCLWFHRVFTLLVIPIWLLWKWSVQQHNRSSQMMNAVKE